MQFLLCVSWAFLALSKHEHLCKMKFYSRWLKELKIWFLHDYSGLSKTQLMMPPARDYVRDILGTILRIQFNQLQLFLPAWRDSVDANEIMHLISMEETRR